MTYFAIMQLLYIFSGFRFISFHLFLEIPIRRLIIGINGWSCLVFNSGTSGLLTIERGFKVEIKSNLV